MPGLSGDAGEPMMYQQPYPPANQPPFPPPAIDPSELRPRRVWYAVAAVIAIVLVGAGIAVFIGGLVAASGTGSIDRRFGSGETVTVRLDAQPNSAIYARVGSGGTDGSDPVPTPLAQCTVVGPSGQETSLDVPSGTFTITRNGTSWRQIYEVAATESGDHRISCRSSDTNAFAVGEVPDAGKLFGGIAGGLIGLFVLPFTGVLIGVIISVVVAVRRSGYRRRMLAQRYPPAY